MLHMLAVHKALSTASDSSPSLSVMSPDMVWRGIAIHTKTILQFGADMCPASCTRSFSVSMAQAAHLQLVIG